MRILSDKLKSHIGRKVEISGWLHKKRLLGGLNFIILRDRAGIVQILDKTGEESKKIDDLHYGTIIKVEGKVIKDSRAPNGVELHNPKLTVEVGVTELMPIEIDKPINHKPDNLHTLFENRVINLRNITEKNIFKIQAEIEEIIRQFLISRDFLPFHSPKLLAGSNEGGAEVFKLDYFDQKATLAQSAQFYKQILAGVYERVFEIGSTYRAEPSTTTRHMSEFITIDVEMGFIDSLDDLMDLLSDMLNQVNNQVWEKCQKELESLKSKKVKLTKKIPVITLKDLHQKYFEDSKEDLRHEKDPAPSEERWASEYGYKKYGSEAIFITDFPSSGMVFYHKKSQKDPNIAERADLILRGTEIVTLSMREHRYDKLVEQLINIGANPKDPGFIHYLQAFKYGMPPHGGFGLGLERLTQKIIGLHNVKEATIFPRDMGRLTP
ncbi:MAG: aspartate--tRNA(Asn) ligase [bacterium]|nr:aspartate--tRNA(Asn) ligase [bacterium]